MYDLFGLTRYILPVLAAIILALCSAALLRRRPQSLGEVFIVDTKSNKIYPLISRETSIGLHKNCDIVLNYEGVINEHAVIICGKDAWYVRKVQKDTPVFVNGKPIKDTALIQNGDFVGVGSVNLLFQYNPGGQYNG